MPINNRGPGTTGSHLRVDSGDASNTTSTTSGTGAASVFDPPASTDAIGRNVDLTGDPVIDLAADAFERANRAITHTDNAYRIDMSTMAENFQLRDIDGTAMAPVLRGLDLDKLENAKIKVRMPLSAGDFVLPTEHKADAQVRVSKDGEITLDVEIRRGPDRKPRIHSADLAFDPPLTVLNPASSLQPDADNPGGFMDRVRDFAGDVIISGFFVDKDGKIEVDGTVDQPWPMRDKPLADEVAEGTFPTINLDLRKILAGDLVAEAANPSADDDDDDLTRLIRNVGAQTDKGTFELTATTEETTIKLSAHGLSMWSDHQQVKLDIDGSIDVDKDGNFNLVLPDDVEPEITSGAGGIDLVGTGKASLHDDNTVRGVVNLVTRAKVEGVEGVLRGAENRSIPVKVKDGQSAVVGRTQINFVDDQIDIDNGVVKAELGLSLPQGITVAVDGVDVVLDRGDVVAGGNMRFGLHDQRLTIADGQFDISVTGDSATIGLGEVHTRAAGVTEFRVLGEDINLDAVSAYPSADGTARLAVTPSGWTTSPVWAEVGYEMTSEGFLYVTPGESGLDQFAAPLDTSTTGMDSISAPAGPGAGPIGGPAFRAHMEKITGAKIRSNNKTELLIDGDASRKKRLEMIKSAKKSICLQTLIFKDDVTGTETVNELIAAAKRGVDVRIIIDAMGNVETPEDILEGKALYKKLRDAGVHVELFNDPHDGPFGPILSEVLRNPELDGLDNVADLANNPQVGLALLQDLVLVASGAKPVSIKTRNAVRQALRQAAHDSSHVDGAVNMPTSAVEAAVAQTPLSAEEVMAVMKHAAELNYRWHEKYLVVDGSKAITGGMNVADEYLFGGTDRTIHALGEERPAWRDTDVYVEGQAAHDNHLAFAKNWRILTGKDAVPAVDVGAQHVVDAANGGGVDVQFIQHHPRIEGDHHITNIHIEALKALKPGEKAYFANAYLLPSGALENLKKAMIAAAQRGVDVRIVTNSRTTTDMPQLNDAAVFTMLELVKGGVKLYERTGMRTMHTKAASFGGKVCTVGSWNMDNRSAALHSEANAFIYDDSVSASVEKMIVDDMKPDVAREIKAAELVQQIQDGGLRNVLLASFSNLM